MPSDNLKNMLELSKKMEEVVSSSAKSNKPLQYSSSKAMNLEEQLSMFDEQVFGKYDSSQEKKGYSAEENLEAIKKRNTQELKREITNPILQEVLNNPYDFDDSMIESMLNPPKMKELEEKLSNTTKKSALDTARSINENLEKLDKEKIAEKNLNNNKGFVNTSIDYSLIKTIVESVINEKIDSLKNSLLTESQNRTSANKMSMIMLGENFTFVDSEGNMYKCGDLKYVGKAKMKQK